MQKIKNISFLIPNILLVLGLGLILRIILSPFGTLSLDQNTFIAWSIHLAKDGLGNFYKQWSDYLPGYLYFLWFLGKIRAFVPIPDVILFKTPALLGDIITGYLIFKIVKKIRNEKWAILASSLYIFNPAVIANSTLWGQVDGLTSLFSLLSIYLISSNFLLSALFLGFGALIKPQAGVTLLVVIFVMIRDKWKYQKALLYLAVCLFTFLVGFLPFTSFEKFPFFIYERISATLNQYPYTSVNAFNFWGILGFWQRETLITQIIGLLSTLVIFLISVRRLFKHKFSEFMLLGILFVASFLFFTRMHERHFLPALAPLIIGFVSFPAVIISYVGFSIIYLANLFYSYNWITYNFARVFSDSGVEALAFVNLGLLAFLIWSPSIGVQKLKSLVEGIKISNYLKRKYEKDSFPKINLPLRLSKLLLILLISFSFLSRVIYLNLPNKEYFDEVYHAFTAREILNKNPKAWEWWNTPPTGFAYEWTHPPVAKLGMVLGMLVFGENSFGWRIPGAILGTASVFLVYLIAKHLFKDEYVGLLSAAVFSLDGLVLVMSRIGMNDTYHLFFILLSIYLFLKDRNFLSALFFGLALASKWSALWAIPIFLLIWFLFKKDFKKEYLWFLVIPPLIYLASYFDMFLTGHDLNIFWGVQKQMWWYHTRLKASHPYTSTWWSWPVLLRPIYLYTSDEIKGTVSRIYAFGNPVVFWFGLFSILASVGYLLRQKSKSLGLVVFSYLIFFVPWALSPRIMFLYHYLPSLPFLSIATGFFLRKNLKMALPILGIGGLVFVYFYPHWAGLNIPLWLDKSYYWFSSWR